MMTSAPFTSPRSSLLFEAMGPRDGFGTFVDQWLSSVWGEGNRRMSMKVNRVVEVEIRTDENMRGGSREGDNKEKDSHRELWERK